MRLAKRSMKRMSQTSTASKALPSLLRRPQGEDVPVAQTINPAVAAVVPVAQAADAVLAAVVVRVKQTH